MIGRPPNYRTPIKNALKAGPQKSSKARRALQIFIIHDPLQKNLERFFAGCNCSTVPRAPLVRPLPLQLLQLLYRSLCLNIEPELT